MSLSHLSIVNHRCWLRIKVLICVIFTSSPPCKMHFHISLYPSTMRESLVHNLSGQHIFFFSFCQVFRLGLVNRAYLLWCVYLYVYASAQFGSHNTVDLRTVGLSLIVLIDPSFSLPQLLLISSLFMGLTFDRFG